MSILQPLPRPTQVLSSQTLHSLVPSLQTDPGLTLVARFHRFVRLLLHFLVDGAFFFSPFCIGSMSVLNPKCSSCPQKLHSPFSLWRQVTTSAAAERNINISSSFFLFTADIIRFISVCYYHIFITKVIILLVQTVPMPPPSFCRALPTPWKQVHWN